MIRLVSVMNTGNEVLTRLEYSCLMVALSVLSSMTLVLIDFVGR